MYNRGKARLEPASSIFMESSLQSISSHQNTGCFSLHCLNWCSLVKRSVLMSLWDDLRKTSTDCSTDCALCMDLTSMPFVFELSAAHWSDNALTCLGAQWICLGIAGSNRPTAIVKHSSRPFPDKLCRLMRYHFRFLALQYNEAYTCIRQFWLSGKPVQSIAKRKNRNWHQKDWAAISTRRARHHEKIA